MLILATATLGLFAAPVVAHDLKVMASRFTLDSPGKSTVFLSWGHLLPVDELVDAKTIERYDILTPKGKVSLKTREVSFHANVVILDEPGLYQVVVSRKPSLLTWVIDADGNRVMRRGSRDTFKDEKIDVSLRSQMFSKALITVKGDLSPVKAVGLPLEIVPVDPPAKWKAGGMLRVRVLQEGKPAAGIEIHATFIGAGSPSDQPAAKTNDEGIAELRTKTASVWVLKAVQRIPTKGVAREQFDFDARTTTLILEVTP